MSPRSDIPEPWRTAMENAGLYNTSARALAEKAGIGTTTVTGLVHGRRQSDEQTLQAVADALRLKVTTIREWASQALGQEAPFELPAEFNQLNRKQREALLTVGRAMLNPAEEPTGTSAGDDASSQPTPSRDASDERYQPDLSRAEGLVIAETQPLRVVPESRKK